MSDEHVWYRCNLIEDEISGSAGITIDADKPITNTEFTNVQSALRLLTETIEASPYRELEERHNAFKTCIEDIVTSLNSRKAQNDLRQISRKLDDFLSAFRAFDDRTSHNLSSRYGNKSIQFLQFKEALSYEFDNVFEYRFFCQLRNYGQHAGSPISHLRASSYLENDQIVSVCNPTFDSRKLLDAYKKWTGKVRPDLEKKNGEFSVEQTLGIVMRSCARALLKSIQSQKKELQAALATLERHIGHPETYSHPALVQMKKDPSTPEDLGQLKIVFININLIGTTKDLLEKSGK